jgi:hypothetical protein
MVEDAVAGTKEGGDEPCQEFFFQNSGPLRVLQNHQLLIILRGLTLSILDLKAHRELDTDKIFGTGF